MNDSVKKNRAYTPTTFSRVMAVLKCFSFSAPELTMNDIANQLHISKSTLYRYLTIMEEEGYLERISNTNRYAVGMRIVELSAIALCRNALRLHGEQELNLLSEEVKLNANLGVIYDGRLLHVAFSTRSGAGSLYSIVGRCAPLTTTAMGKALLSSLPYAEVNQIVRRRGFTQDTPFSIMSLEALHKELQTIRSTGFAFDNQERNLNSKCLATLVYSDQKSPVAAMSITSTNDLSDFDGRIEEIKQALRLHANALSLKLGYHADNLLV